MKWVLDLMEKSVMTESMNENRAPQQKLPFAAGKDSDKFFREAIKLLIREFDNRRKKYVPTNNFQVFFHGQSWSFQRQEPDGFKPHSGEMERQSTDSVVKLDRIRANDIAALTDFIRETADRMEGQLFQRLTAEMSAVTKETSNVVSITKEGSFADAYLKLVKSTEVGVTADGKVSMPTLFLNDPTFIERLEKEILVRGPEFLQQIQIAREEKSQKAIEREAERLAKFEKAE